jgi:predicted transposase YbfD/YdcC
VVAIDGKEICGARSENPDGSFDKLHIVSAWATANGISLGQERVKEKSNEITAIPALIKALDLSGCTVTIDAMGCQKEITSAIIEKEADYVICLKKNQKKFYSTVSSWFDDFQHKHVPPIRYQTFTTTNEGHGRYERRHCEVYSHGALELCFKGWAGLRSIIKLTSLRKDLKTGFETEEIRYYISSIGLEPERILGCIRAHWGIENNLHWHLDVTFNEDSTRKTKNAAANFSLLNKISLMVLKNSSKKGSLKAKGKAAGWDNKVLAQMLDEEWNF